MSEYDLIPIEAYEDLPPDPKDQFTKLVGVARANLTRLMDSSDSGEFAVELRSQFTFLISSIADALGVDGLPPVDPVKLDYEAYNTFQIYLSGVVARMHLGGKMLARPQSVQLGVRNKARIQQQLNTLRRYIEESHLPDEKKKALREKVEKLQKELDKERVGFGRVMEVMAAVGPYILGAPGFVAAFPDAQEVVMSVISLIGQDKEAEEAERLRLAPPPRQLTHNPSTTEQTNNSTWTTALTSTPSVIKADDAVSQWPPLDDDDIPF